MSLASLKTTTALVASLSLLLPHPALVSAVWAQEVELLCLHESQPPCPEGEPEEGSTLAARTAFAVTEAARRAAEAEVAARLMAESAASAEAEALRLQLVASDAETAGAAEAGQAKAEADAAVAEAGRLAAKAETAGLVAMETAAAADVARESADQAAAAEAEAQALAAIEAEAARLAAEAAAAAEDEAQAVAAAEAEAARLAAEAAAAAEAEAQALAATEAEDARLAAEAVASAEAEAQAVAAAEAEAARLAAEAATAAEAEAQALAATEAEDARLAAEAVASAEAEAQAVAAAEAEAARLAAEAAAAAEAEAQAVAAAETEAARLAAEAAAAAEAEAQALAATKAEDAQLAAETAAAEEAKAQAVAAAEAEAARQAEEVAAVAATEAQAVAAEEAEAARLATEAAAATEAEAQALAADAAAEAEAARLAAAAAEASVVINLVDPTVGESDDVPAAARTAAAPQDVVEETLNALSIRTSSQEFTTTIYDPAAVETQGNGLTNIEKALLLGLGAVVVGSVLRNGDKVVANTGDRVVVEGARGLTVYKDDDTLLRQPGATMRTENFADGSMRTTLDREDGAQVVTIRDPRGRVLRRAVTYPNGTQYNLFDDLQPEPAVNVHQLEETRPVPRRLSASENDLAALRAALSEDQAFDAGRTFNLRQIREIEQVRSLVPAIELDTMTFPTSSAAIPPAQARSLLRLGILIEEMLLENPREMFLIEGHTDAVGSGSQNLSLSDRRAESVALALTENFHISPENLIVQGYGEAFPRVQTQAAEERNRRVTARRITPLLRQIAEN
jgi:outer membrane protein OmpA-like peptidoglycan-associated protein